MLPLTTTHLPLRSPKDPPQALQARLQQLDLQGSLVYQVENAFVENMQVRLLLLVLLTLTATLTSKKKYDLFALELNEQSIAQER